MAKKLTAGEVIDIAYCVQVGVRALNTGGKNDKLLAKRLGNSDIEDSPLQKLVTILQENHT